MTEEEKSFPFHLILLLATIGMVATDLYLPSLPFIQEYFHSAKASVQISLTFFLLGFSFSQVLYGPLSDRYGRRPIVVLGLGIGFLGSLICLFTPSVFFLNLGRFVQGFGLGSGATLFRTILRDVYSGDALARVGAWTAITSAGGMAMAPIVGGYIQREFGWRAVFIFLGLYAFGVLYLLWKKLPETNKQLNLIAMTPKVFFGSYKELISHPIFIGYSGCAGLALAGFSTYFASSPFLFENILHLTAEQYGLLAMIISVGLGLGGVTNAWLIPRFGRHRLLVLGTFFLFFGGFLMLILSSEISVFRIMLPMSLYACGCAFVFANSFAGAFYPFGHMAGFAGALYGCIQISGGVIASALISTIQEKNQIPLSLFLMTLGILAYLFQLMAFRASHR